MLVLSIVCCVLLGNPAFGVTNDDLRELFENAYSRAVLPLLKMPADAAVRKPSLEDLRELFEKRRHGPKKKSGEKEDLKPKPKPEPSPDPDPKPGPESSSDPDLKENLDDKKKKKNEESSTVSDTKSKEIFLTIRERRRLNRQDRIKALESTGDN